MAKSRYSVEQKKMYVEAYREATKNQIFLNAEEIARWCNETYMLVDKLHGRDFRRPQEMKEWFEQINNNIAIKVGPKGKKVQVITASLIDIEHVVATCRSPERLRRELQNANKRFADTIDAVQLLSKELAEEKEARKHLERDETIIKENHDRALKELKKKGREQKTEMAKIKKQLAEKKRSEKMLLQYMCKYIADPIAADHFANELRLLATYPGREVVLPEHLKELKNDDRPFGTIISAFDEWIGVVEDDEEEIELEEEDFEDEIVESELEEPVTVLSEGETKAINMLENL